MKDLNKRLKEIKTFLSQACDEPVTFEREWWTDDPRVVDNSDRLEAREVHRHSSWTRGGGALGSRPPSKSSTDFATMRLLESSARFLEARNVSNHFGMVHVSYTLLWVLPAAAPTM